MGPISTYVNFSLDSTIPMPNWCNDQALARIEQVCASAMKTLSPPTSGKERQLAHALKGTVGG
jgi:hypothetical protein